MTTKQFLISRIASHGLTGLGIALITSAALVAQVQARAATTGESSVAAQAGPAMATTAAMRGTFQGPGLSIREISERVEGVGYRSLSDIEWEDGFYKVEGLTGDGRAVKLYVDGNNGKVLSVRARR